MTCRLFTSKRFASAATLLIAFGLLASANKAFATPVAPTSLALHTTTPSGGNVTLTANLYPFFEGSTSSDGEAITFTSGGTILGTSTLSSGQATLTIATPAVGAYVYATYGGDTVLASSTSNSVEPGGAPAQLRTSLGLTSSANPSVQNSNVTLTATLYPYFDQAGSTNGETVTFYRNGTSIGTGTLSNGVATFTTSTLPVGSSTLQAQYLADANFTGSISNRVVQSVTSSSPPANTSTLLSVNNNPSTHGNAVTLTSTVYPFNNVSGQTITGDTVTFTAAGTQVASCTETAGNGGVCSATYNFPTAGTFQLQAHFQGDPEFNASNSNAINEVIN